MRVVLDTNVLVAGLRSRLGASFRVLSLLPRRRFEICVSVPLVVEYEDVLLRGGPGRELSEADVHDVVDYLCSVGHRQDIYYLWRPVLRDPKDDLVLEVAVAGGCDAIVTFHREDFEGASRFGILVLTPGELLLRIGDGS